MDRARTGPSDRLRRFAGKCFSAMLPFESEAAGRHGGTMEFARMWGRSHTPPYDCGRLKNFAPPVEPCAVPTRPILRDGH